MFRVAWRGLMSRKLRLLLTALAIALGVAFVSGTYVLTDTMDHAFTSLFSSIGSKTDVVVRAASPMDPTTMQPTDRGTMPESLLNQVYQARGVKVAEGDVFGYAQIVGKDGKAITTSGAPTLGVSTDPVKEMSTSTVREGDPNGPTNSTQMSMDAQTARANGFHVGDRVRVLFEGPSREFTLVNTFGFGNVDSMAGATVVAFDLQTAQDVLNKPGQVDEIKIIAKPGYTQEQVRDNVGKLLGPRYETITGTTDADRTAQTISNAMGFFSTALMVFGGVALFVGAFIIFNTFSILVAQRVREFGLLRALGASSRQVTLSVLLEALALGILSSVVGILLGFGIAAGLYKLLDAVGMSMPSTALQFQPRTAIVAFVVGVGVTTVAALAPALRTRMVSPMAALQTGLTSEPEQAVRRRLRFGVPATVLGVGLLLYGMFGKSSQALLLVAGGAILVFVGVSSLSALVARQMASVIGWPFARLFGMTGRLGRGNAMRSPSRTARTAAALMIGLALVSFVSIFGASLKASATQTVDNVLAADYLITPQSQMSPGFSPDLAQSITQIKGVATVAETRLGRWLRGTTTETVVGADPYALTQAMHLTIDSGNFLALGNSGVAVSRARASQYGYHVGDVITVHMPQTGTQRLRVAAIVNAEGLNTEYVIGMQLFQASFPIQLDNSVSVKLYTTADRTAVSAALNQAVAGYPNAKLEDAQQFKESNAKSIDQLLNLVYTLLFLAVIIALFGIVNTLALSVFERVRELGLLRAVGMTKPEVRRMIRWEAVIVALLGAVLGIAVGAVFGWMAVLAMHDQGLSVLSIPLGQLGLFLALAALAGVVAAVAPARRASNVDMLQSIATT